MRGRARRGKASTVSDDIICGQCPAVYAPHEIDVFLNGEKTTTLALLLNQRGVGVQKRRSPRSKRIFRQVVGMPTEPARSPASRRTLHTSHLRAYTFKCPHEHTVDGNPGAQFGLAVVGATGASKSHVLAAMLREMYDMSALRRMGVTLSDAIYQNPRLAQDVVTIYRKGKSLEPTPAGSMLGPYGFKLTIGRGIGDSNASEYSLLLYDVAGEDLDDIVKVAENASFILLCSAIVVLIDPVDLLPTQFDPAGTASERARIDAARDVRGGIQVLANTLKEVWSKRTSRDLEIPICFVIAKADAIDWVDGFSWERHTSQVIAAAAHGGLSDALIASSNATREAISRMGGDLIIDEIEDRFDASWIRYAAASATCAMPIQNADGKQEGWADEPMPNGVALSVLQILELSGLLPRPSDSGPEAGRGSGADDG